MATANRSNPYQPVPAGGSLDVFDRLFVSTPAYRGDGQPARESGGLTAVIAGLFGSTQPVYRTAPRDPAEPCAACDGDNVNSSDSCTDASGTTPGMGDAPLTIVITRD
jgi:hypothetical protein